MFDTKHIVIKDSIIPDLRTDICQGNVNLIQVMGNLLEENDVFQYLMSPNQQYYQSNCKKKRRFYITNLILH